MNALIDMTPPKVDKTKRPNFDYTSECGYYVCDTCGTPAYPMEVEDSEYGYQPCFTCENGDFVQVIK